MNALIKYGLGDFPALFSRQWLDELYDDFDRSSFFLTDKSTFPYDVVDVKNDKDETIASKIIFAVGGVKKEDIEVSVSNHILSVNIKSSNGESSKSKEVVRRKGIARRSMKLDWGLHNVEEENITARLENGELIVNLPINEEASKKRQIELQ